jgi:hypothetical protein
MPYTVYTMLLNLRVNCKVLLHCTMKKQLRTACENVMVGTGEQFSYRVNGTSLNIIKERV